MYIGTLYTPVHISIARVGNIIVGIATDAREWVIMLICVGPLQPVLQWFFMVGTNEKTRAEVKFLQKELSNSKENELHVKIRIIADGEAIMEIEKLIGVLLMSKDNLHYMNYVMVYILFRDHV